MSEQKQEALCGWDTRWTYEGRAGRMVPKMLWVQIMKGLVSHAKEGRFCPVDHGEPVKTQAGQ